jgi:cytochrome P450
VTETDSIYYDPYDFEIDTDPYPVWRRMRDEAPLYYNEKYDFFALTRFEDVERCLIDWGTYISGKGTILELIKSGFQIPPGSILFEDPPAHDLHRSLLARLFSPKRIADIADQVRAFTVSCLDPFVGEPGFDFIEHLGAVMPMRVIGMLLGIPEQDQADIRRRSDSGLQLADGTAAAATENYNADLSVFAEYVDWREAHPSDDLMTELIQAEFEDETGTVRRLRRDEILGYIGLLAGAGNETTTRLIGWTGKVLAENPDQRRLLVEDPALIPNAIEELLRYEAPSPVQVRYIQHDVEHYGRTIPAGNVMLLVNGSGNRDERRFPDPDRFDVRRKIGHHLSFGYGLHFCMGASLARMEGRVALEEVLRRWPEWDVDHANAEQARTSTVRGWNKLPVLTR